MGSMFKRYVTACVPFLYVSILAPGSTSDVVALRQTSLNQLIEDLPLAKYVLGDNA